MNIVSSNCNSNWFRRCRYLPERVPS